MDTTNSRTAPVIRNVPAGEVAELKTVDGLIIEMFRSGKYTGDRDGLIGFRPAKIIKDGAAVWTFQNAGIEPGRFADLVEYGEDEYVLSVQDGRVVFGIVRVRDFAHSVKAKFAGKTTVVGGSSMEEILDIKIAVATGLGLDYWYTADEGEILQKRAQLAREADQLKNAEEDAVNQAAKNEVRLRREQFVAGVLARKTVEAWSADGKHLFGIPVTADAEWLCLPHGKYVMLIDNDQPVEAFIVDKKGSRVKKLNQTVVSANKPAQNEASADMPEASDQRTIKLRDETRSVLIFDDVSAVKRLQAAGLNSGTWVGVLPKGSDTLTVYAVTKNGYDTVGQLKKKSSAQPTA